MTFMDYMSCVKTRIYTYIYINLHVCIYAYTYVYINAYSKRLLLIHQKIKKRKCDDNIEKPKRIFSPLSLFFFSFAKAALLWALKTRQLQPGSSVFHFLTRFLTSVQGVNLCLPAQRSLVWSSLNNQGAGKEWIRKSSTKAKYLL